MQINKQQLETTACPLCQSTKLKAKRFNFEPFTVVQCQNCQLWYLSPRLTETEMLKAYADGNYFLGNSEYGYSEAQSGNYNYFDQQASLKRTFQHFLTRLHKRNMLGGHLLEIGCGYGYLLEMAAPYFTERSGTDFDAKALDRVKALGCNAILGGAEQLPAQQHYDCMIATGVIEHIYQPHEFVQQLRQHLTPNGWLILATPQMNSFWFKLQGKNWASFKIPEHVTYYDAHTLTALLQKNGATTTQVLPYPHAFPLGLIAAKLGINLPKFLAHYYLWLPATMFAVAAQF